MIDEVDADGCLGPRTARGARVGSHRRFLLVFWPGRLFTHTVDGKNPVNSPVEGKEVEIPLFTRFYTPSQVV